MATRNRRFHSSRDRAQNSPVWPVTTTPCTPSWIRSSMFRRKTASSSSPSRVNGVTSAVIVPLQLISWRSISSVPPSCSRSYTAFVLAPPRQLSPGARSDVAGRQGIRACRRGDIVDPGPLRRRERPRDASRTVHHTGNAGVILQNRDVPPAVGRRGSLHGSAGDDLVCPRDGLRHVKPSDVSYGGKKR